MHDPEAHAHDESVGVASVVVAAWPLLASIGLLMVGSGLQGSLLGVRAELAMFDSTAIGAVLGLYYLGYVAGSAVVPGLIGSVGHIRVFAALASMASGAVVIHGIWVVPGAWMVLRFLTGLCVAGLFIVTESWLSDVSTPRTRGTLLAIYNTVVTAGLAVGSLLLNTADVGGVVLFVVGSVLLSVAAVPVALAPHDAPPPKPPGSMPLRTLAKIAPLGLVGSTLSGFLTGSILGFGAVFATRAGFGVSGASQFIAAVLIGAVVGQVPLGRWSDRTDRRRVLAVAALLVAAGAVSGVAGTVGDSFGLVLVAAVLGGAGSFSLYGLSFAHLADWVEPAKMPAAGARVITVNGFGAAAGPVTVATVTELVGPEAIFEVTGAAALLFVVYVAYRIFRRDPSADADRGAYVPLSAVATVASVEDVAAENAGVVYADDGTFVDIDDWDDDWDGEDHTRRDLEDRPLREP